MAIIMEKDPEKVIKLLKDLKEHVFKVTKEVIYAIPEGAVIHYKDYNDFLKYAKENPKKIFTDYFKIFETVKEVEEL